MIQGIRVAADAMVALARAQDVTAHNIANSDTVGFRKDIPVFKNFQNTLKNALRDSGSSSRETVVVDATVTDRQQGRVVPTGNLLDLALVGEGYFAVQTPAGIRYTRAGTFGLDQNRTIVSSDGHPVLGLRGPIVVPERGNVSISPEGVIEVDGSPWDQFVVVTGAPDAFIKEGLHLYRYTAAEEPVRAAPEVLSDHLEMSTVEPLQEIVSMIAHLRGFESAQRAIQLQDITLNKAVNEVGKVA